MKIRQSTVAQRRPESTGSGHASGHSSRSACDGGGQIRFSSVCANATARSSGMRPITRRLRPGRADHQASDRSPRRSERIGVGRPPLAMMQSKTGAPEWINVGDHAQRRAIVREHERHGESQDPGAPRFRALGDWPPPSPRGRFSSIACNWASGFKGEKVSLVYRFVYSATSQRQSSCSLGSQKLTATHAAAPAASSPMAMPAASSRRAILAKRFDGWRTAGPGVAGRASAQAELVRAASGTTGRLAGQPPAIRRTAGAVAHPPPGRAQRAVLRPSSSSLSINATSSGVIPGI